MTSPDEARSLANSLTPSFGDIMSAMETIELLVLQLASIIAVYATCIGVEKPTLAVRVQAPTARPGPPARVTDKLPLPDVPEDFGMAEALPDSATLDRVVRTANKALRDVTTNRPPPPKARRPARRRRKVKSRRRR